MGLYCSLLYSINALPHDFEVEGIYYKIISSSEKTLKVSYKGNNSYSYSNEYKGDVSIPDKVHYNGIDYTVIEIQSSAFEGCSELSSIIIPSNVTSIGNNAFRGCVKLSTIVIEDGESVLSIGHDTSSSNGKNLKFLSDCPIKQLYIGRELSYNSSEEYGLSPFCNCSNQPY